MSEILSPGVVIRGMVEHRRLAARARCRIKNWHLSHAEALRLSIDLALPFGESPDTIYKEMCAGKSFVLGATVHIR